MDDKTAQNSAYPWDKGRLQRHYVLLDVLCFRFISFHNWNLFFAKRYALLKRQGNQIVHPCLYRNFFTSQQKRSQNSCIFFAPCGIIITQDKMRYGGQEYAYQNYT